MFCFNRTREFIFLLMYYIKLITENSGFSTDMFLCCTEDAQLSPLLRLGAGACAGIIAMSATYPMDMVRGRITVQVMYQQRQHSITQSTSVSYSVYWPLNVIYADGKVSLSVPWYVSCIGFSIPWRRLPCSIQRVASICYRSGRSLL